MSRFVFPVLILLGLATGASGWEKRAAELAGKGGIVHVVDADDQVLYSRGAKGYFKPASTLKVMTCLLAAEHLGMDSRFKTELFLDGRTLVVRGKGDPFLVSEELDILAARVVDLLGDGVATDGVAIDGVAIDDSFFSDDVEVPGVGGSERSYDALNTATGVNFNTIHVNVKGKSVRSAEPQTPITPIGKRLARRRGIRGKGRISLSSNAADLRQYAGELIAAKLRSAGAKVGASVRVATAPDQEPLYVHENSRTVGEVCTGLLYYSNNYIANQVFLAVGAAVEGAPAGLAKSVKVAERFVAARPELSGIVMTEGSGISYENRVTAQAMVAALKLFEPYKPLLRVQHESPSKTGTLKVTKTVVGFLETRTHGTVRYMISLDGSGYGRRWQIVDLLRLQL